jgi:hypothetical protein
MQIARSAITSLSLSRKLTWSWITVWWGGLQCDQDRRFNGATLDIYCTSDHFRPSLFSRYPDLTWPDLITSAGRLFLASSCLVYSFSSSSAMVHNLAMA